ncbi:MAG TPA: hypothetical protein VLK82_24720 [Candidatus Tectomicrobia bacterium]|nr:hypothetical protein [Candidatus Tectomicrobia bacterium]
MAVVIHEFQVDVQPDNQATEPAPSVSAKSTQAIGAQELERLLRRQTERARRVWAH